MRLLYLLNAPTWGHNNNSMPDHLDIWIPAAVVIAGAIFNSGILFATVRIHGNKLKEHDVKHKEHDTKLENHGEKLVKLLAWHDGFTAGTHRG